MLARVSLLEWWSEGCRNRKYAVDVGICFPWTLATCHQIPSEELSDPEARDSPA